MDALLISTHLLLLLETTFIALKKFKPVKSGNRKIYVDTSVIIDGRILNIARTGFIDGDLIILKSVLTELQLLADGKDNEKRNRARIGLNNVSELERVIEVNTDIVDDGTERKKVDEQLLKYAKVNKGTIMTLDYNLIKVAEAEKIDTLNINDLALAVKTEHLPGTKTKLRITEKGSNRGQGVGHLSDGTMVVVEHASRKIGKEITVEFERLHETSSGKMIFAKILRG
ncbi:TRAM domain-containing protein [Candidatus Saccharibacteria bacterium]|nr:TRAM domain-containing protein [Candidatus Saccharibacteria bacterium]